MRKCSICKRDYRIEEIKIPFYGIQSNVEVADCDCEARREEENRMERDKQYMRQVLSRKFENSLLTPFFQEKEFNKIPESEIKTKLKEYIEAFNPKTSKGIIFIGDVGTGKTTLLACTCKELILKGYACLFIKMSSLLDKFINACSFDSEDSVEKLKSWLLKFDFIVIDDLGREKYTEKRLEIAFDIIDDLMNYKKCIGITANPAMIEKLKSIPDFGAILDRLFEMCGIQEVFKGESYRRKIYGGKYD